MDNVKKVGMALVVIAIAIGLLGYWIKSYNDKIAQVQVNETGRCYLPDGTCLHATSDSLLYATTGIAIFLVVLGVYLLLRKKESPKVVVKKIIGKPTAEKKEKQIEAPNNIGPELKQIFDIISSSGGAILQGEIVSKSGMDKVRVSRILDKLEMLGLVERRRHGMSNMVVLKKK